MLSVYDIFTVFHVEKPVPVQREAVPGPAGRRPRRMRVNREENADTFGNYLLFNI